MPINYIFKSNWWNCAMLWRDDEDTATKICHRFPIYTIIILIANNTFLLQQCRAKLLSTPQRKLICTSLNMRNYYWMHFLCSYLSPAHVSIVCDSSTTTKWISCRFFKASRNPSAHTASAKANKISGNRGRFSPGEHVWAFEFHCCQFQRVVFSVWSAMMLLRGQITRTQPFDEAESSDFTTAKSWNTRLFPKLVGNTASTSFSLRRPFIARSCSLFRSVRFEHLKFRDEIASLS